MSFIKKAKYVGHIDSDGIPLLDYQGKIGLQYNPIAIAQWGLGNYNLWWSNKSQINYLNFIKSADWLVKNLEENEYGFKVWMHHFNFEYRDLLEAPWYSGLAQGQGISVLVRAFKETKKEKYSNAATDAVKVFNISTFHYTYLAETLRRLFVCLWMCSDEFRWQSVIGLGRLSFVSRKLHSIYPN